MPRLLKIQGREKEASAVKPREPGNVRCRASRIAPKFRSATNRLKRACSDKVNKAFAALGARKLRARAAVTKLLQRDVVGLDIGASHLRAVQLKGGDVDRVHTHRIPSGIIVNGILEEPEELVEELRRFWNLTGIGTKKVSFSIGNHLTALRRTQISAKNESHIEQAVAMNSGELIAPMIPEKSVVDFAELSRSGAVSDLQIAAADLEMVKKFARSVEKAGLYAVSSELGPLAAARALAMPRSPSKTHAVIDIGAELTSITVGSGPDIFSLRVLDLGGNDFTKAVQEEMGLSSDDAEELKIRCGVGAYPKDPTVEQGTFERCRAAMRNVADKLNHQIEQTRLHWDLENPEQPLSSWNIIGGAGRLEGIVESICLYTGLSSPPPLSPYPGLEEAKSLDLNTTALGLARGHAMSLLPDRMHETNVAIPGVRRRSKVSLRRSKRQGKRLVTSRKEKRVSTMKLFALAAVIMAFLGYYQKQRISDDIGHQKEEVSRLEAEVRRKESLGPLPPVYPNSRAATKVAESLSDRSSAQAIERIATVVSSMPTSISSITIEGTQVTLHGEQAATDGASLDDLQDELARSPELAVIQKSADDGENALKITAKRARADDASK